ncbi:MAG TPA: hypothetical protein VF198_06000 [Vicinamibacterales bacterium]
MRLPLLLIMLTAAGLSAAQYPPDTNVDESRVPAYTLPDPLTMESGEPVRDAAAWRERRRPEILRLFETHVYGRTPAERAGLAADEPALERGVLGGAATRKQVTLRIRRNGRELPVELLVYLPAKATGPVPVFLGLNFRGNQAVSTDPGIRLAKSWLPDRDPGVVNHRATDASRGTAASRWPVETIVGRGYALATAYYGDFDPDFDDGFANGAHPLFYRPGQSRPADGEWGSIGAWAWGLSRLLDYLETDPDIDATRAAVLGHSRLGKTALWAAAQDERFALAISNDSGCGGAALSRRIFGETVAHITKSFPHWFTARFATYARREAELPVDQHQLLALIAPRPLYVASAADDLWADPRGEFLGALGADPVYRLLGTEGLGTTEWPAVDTPVGRTIGYHVRRGGHDVTDYDWAQFLAFADRHLRAARPAR